MIEREKRWKVIGPLPENFEEQFVIEQVYANINPDVRIRKITKDNQGSYFHTVKYQMKEKNEREEIEQKISSERYSRIFEFIDKKPVVKERTIYVLDSKLKAEVDHFIDTGDTIVEVEFNSVEDMNSFVKPDWFGNEIQSKKSFTYGVFAKINNLDTLWD